MTYTDGDPYPMTDFAPIRYSEVNETVTCKLYDHLNEIEYTTCTTDPEILTGDEHYNDYTDWDNPIYLYFSSPTFEKEISAATTVDNVPGGYYLIATPIGQVSPANVTNMLENTFDLYYFDQSYEKEWINYKGDQNTGNLGGFDLYPGKGYLYANSGNGENQVTVLTFTGFPLSADESFGVVLDYDDNATLKGWNLVGNPFAEIAFIDRDEFYVMNDAGTELIAATNNSIEAMEGIFVEAQGTDEILEFTAGVKNARSSSNKVIISVNKDRDNVIDRAIVRFGNGDLLHKFQINENNTKVYLPQNNEDYAILNASEEGQMPVCFKPAENGEYTMVVTLENLDLEYLHLIDNMTGADVDLLADPKYTFSANTTDYASRFVLRFRADAGVNVNEMFCPMTYRQDGTLAINGILGESELVIIDMLGRVVSKEAFNTTDGMIRNITVTPGVYVLRLMNNNAVYTQKIVVE